MALPFRKTEWELAEIPMSKRGNSAFGGFGGQRGNGWMGSAKPLGLTGM